MSKYTSEDRVDVISDEYCHGEIIADGEEYLEMYGVRWAYITDEDIKQLKAGKMFYTTDGEYAYCLVYKEEECDEN